MYSSGLSACLRGECQQAPQHPTFVFFKLLHSHFFSFWLQSPCLSMSSTSSALSVSQTHCTYGPWGTLGRCYTLPYKQTNRHPQHAHIFFSLTRISLYIFTPFERINVWVWKLTPGQNFSAFVGKTILFSMKWPLHRATILRKFGLVAGSSFRGETNWLEVAVPTSALATN